MSDKFNPDHFKGRSLPTLPLTRAGGNDKPAPASVYLLADHLDTVLAAGEDIMSARLTWNRTYRGTTLDIAADKHSVRDDIENIRKLENTIIMRVLKSRERAEDVARNDKRFRALAKLYTAGTAVLADAANECGDSTEIDFATADTVSSYLRSRGLIDPEAPALAADGDIEIGEDFLIAKRIAAGSLMDLAATLLDALELHYDLFLDEDELAMTPQVDRFEDLDATEEATESASNAPAPVNDELQAAINEVRQDTADPKDLWTRLSAAAAASIAARNKQDEATEETTSDLETLSEATSAGADSSDEQTGKDEAPSEPVSEDDVPTEIMAMSSSSSDADKTSDSEDTSVDHAALVEDDDEEPELSAGAPSDTESPELEADAEDTAAVAERTEDDAVEDDDGDATLQSDDDNSDGDKVALAVQETPEEEDAPQADASESVDADTDSESDADSVAVDDAIASENDGETDAADENGDDVLTFQAANDDVDEVITKGDGDQTPDEDADSQADAADESDIEINAADDDDAAKDAASASEETAGDSAQEKPKSLLSRLSLLRPRS